MRYFDNWLRAFSDYASIGEAPIKYYFWAGVSTIAGALRRQVWIDQGHFQWVPNFYIILVAPPGVVTKTTTIDIGKNLLQQVKGINFGPDVITWQALSTTLAKCSEQVIMPDGSFIPMSALTLVSGEFGTFLNPSDREMVDVLVTLWDGRKGNFHKVTKTQGEEKIENPWINIIACTTPAWISGNMPQYMIGGGFTSRCVFVFAEEKRQYVAYPGNNLPASFFETQRKLVHDLTQIASLKGPYLLSPDAIKWGEKWYNSHWHERPLLRDQQFQGYWARKQTHMHKLAMIIAASSREERTIEVSDLELALGMLGGLEEDMEKVFANIGQTDASRSQGIVLDTLKKVKRIDKQTLYREMLFKSITFSEFENAISSAINAGLILQVVEGDKVILRLIAREDYAR
jgi:Protein of unknown function (DUF3987)